jgi:tripartite ATP-independent transporter DctP family solute receptor
LALLVALTACRDGGETRTLELKFGHVGAPGSLFAVSAEEFARRANAALGDRARVAVFGSSQLGSDGVMLQKLKLGTLDFALPSTVMSSQIDELGLFEMPYLVHDRAHMRRIEDEIFWPRLAPLAEAKGYKILAVWENGFRHITNDRRPIRVPADLEGIKLRTPRGLWRVKMFQSYGANPTPMALSEVFVALETGVMDGQENPFAQIWSSRFHEVQKYLSLTGHVYTPAYLTVGARRWANLPEDVRAIFERTGRETRDFVFTTAARMDEELLEKLKTAGIEVNEADRESFAAASREIYRRFSETVTRGGELVEAAAALSGR